MPSVSGPPPTGGPTPASGAGNASERIPDGSSHPFRLIFPIDPHQEWTPGTTGADLTSRLDVPAPR